MCCEGRGSCSDDPGAAVVVHANFVLANAHYLESNWVPSGVSPSRRTWSEPLEEVVMTGVGRGKIPMPTRHVMRDAISLV